MTNDVLRLTCLQMSIEVIKATKEYVEPWDRANKFYNYVKTGDQNKAPDTVKVQRRGKATAPAKPTKK